MTTIALTAQSCTDQFNLLAERLNTASTYGDQRVLNAEEADLVIQAGRLLADAVSAKLIIDSCAVKGIEGNRSMNCG